MKTIWDKYDVDHNQVGLWIKNIWIRLYGSDVTCIPVTDFKTPQIMCFFTLEKSLLQVPVNSARWNWSMSNLKSLTANLDPS